MKDARHERKALLVVSDGGDNRSRYTEGEVRSQVRESDVEIYSIGIFDPYAPRRKSARARSCWTI
jgi:Ca-activated chloride channel family protein